MDEGLTTAEFDRTGTSAPVSRRNSAHTSSIASCEERAELRSACYVSNASKLALVGVLARAFEQAGVRERLEQLARALAIVFVRHPHP